LEGADVGLEPGENKNQQNEHPERTQNSVVGRYQIGAVSILKHLQMLCLLI